MINITIGENGTPSPNMINLGSQFENLDEVIQFTFTSDLEPLNKYVVAKTYDSKKKENITRVTPLVDNRFVIGSAITKVTGTWLLYTLCKSYSADSDNGTIDNIERVSISDPIVATVTENDFDISEIEATEIDPNIKIIYDELIDFKKTLEANEATRQSNEAIRVENETSRVSAETARKEAETTRVDNETSRLNAESTRASAEVARSKAEETRASNETARQSAESQREQAETARQEAENTRSNNEQTRINAESERTQYETLRRQSEGTRLANEESRSNAEKTRIQSEQERTTAETARASAETTRQSNENERVNAETNRATAESERAEAETTRLNNETARVDAEQLRVSAETARDTAEKARAEAEARREGTINGFKDTIDSKITKFYATNSGDTHLVDADNGKIMDMLVYGKAEQFKTIGKNYFDFSKIPTSDKMDTDGGAIVVDYSKQTLTIPSKTYYANTKKTLKDLCPNITTGTYTISMNRSNTESVDYIFILNGVGKVKLNTPVEISNEDLNCYVVFYNNTDSNSENVISNIQIEQGSSATAYEPYTGAKPSPSPEYPQDIKSVVNPTIKLRGANILKFNDLEESTFTKNGITFSSKDGVIKAKGTALIDDSISTDSSGTNHLLDGLTLESGKTYI